MLRKAVTLCMKRNTGRGAKPTFEEYFNKISISL